MELQIVHDDGRVDGRPGSVLRAHADGSEDLRSGLSAAGAARNQRGCKQAGDPAGGDRCCMNFLTMRALCLPQVPFDRALDAPPPPLTPASVDFRDSFFLLQICDQRPQVGCQVLQNLDRQSAGERVR